MPNQKTTYRKEKHTKTLLLNDINRKSPTTQKYYGLIHNIYHSQKINSEKKLGLFLNQIFFYVIFITALGEFFRRMNSVADKT